MQKSKFLALLGILAVFMTLVACPPPAETSEDEKKNEISAIALTTSDAIVGKMWDDHDSYLYYPYNVNDLSYDCRISTNFIETASYGRQEGTIYQKKISETSGYIYYKITNSASFTYSNKDAADYQDKWYAVYYKDLTANSVKISDAYPSFEPYDPVTYKIADYHCADSLSDAIATFTVENEYFASEPPTYTIVTQ